MTTVAQMTGATRAMLRDFPKYFEISEGPLNTLTIRLPHPYVTPTSLQVYVAAPPVPPATDSTVAITDKWDLDERNGLLKMTDESYLGQHVIVGGYHYVWFADADLVRAVQDVSGEVLYSKGGEIEDLNDVEAEVVEMGAVVRALWSLSIELALDIDVSTPEGMFIPAHQRYAQVLQMMQYWEGEYNSRAGSLNIGLGALEIFRLRRVSYTTGRYVPVYRDREFDDPRWPERLYPPIPEGTMGENEVPLWKRVQTASEVTMGNYPAVTWPAFLGRGG
jgi:hypothetical protein